ncbi:MAG: hypothetical protein OXC44_01430 [Proteobacteria bacterium]|nr:hypothetical protein [Pseudomonadota bacterium]
MTKQSMLFIHFILFFLLLSCQDTNHSDFSTTSASSTYDSSDQIYQIHTEKLTSTLDLEIKQGGKKTKVLPVKMLWLIDNSGSMQDDVSRVQAGIKGFVDALKENHGIDITVTFVSCLVVSKSTCINPSTVSHPSITLVNLIIESLDGLTTAALLLSKEDLFRKVRLQPGLPINNSNVAAFFNSFSPKGEAAPTFYSSALMSGKTSHSKIRKIRSTLNHYFNNNDATNVIVSVTDDRTELSDVHFMNFLKINYGSTDSFKFYGYIHPKSDGNSYYKNLAHKLNGKTYDITSASETAYGTFFKDLANEIQVSTTVNTFTLKSKCTSVEHILLDGNALHSSLYSCKGTELTVNENAINTGKKITVKYYIEQK